MSSYYRGIALDNTAREMDDDETLIEAYYRRLFESACTVTTLVSGPPPEGSYGSDTDYDPYDCETIHDYDNDDAGLWNWVRRCFCAY